jgi:uncharacterized membrane protein YqjE
MTNGEPNSPRLPGLVTRLARTGLAALQNRGELFLVELQEERIRLIELFLWAGVTVCLGLGFLIVFTATIILLFNENLRIYAAGGFSLLYLLATIFALLNLRALAKSSATPFPDTVAEIQKDREWLESLK